MPSSEVFVAYGMHVISVHSEYGCMICISQNYHLGEKPKLILCHFIYYFISG